MENSSENPSVETGENRPIGHMIRAADGTDVPVFDVWIERRRSGEDYAYRTMYYVQTAEGVVPLDAAAYLANVTLDPSRP